MISHPYPDPSPNSFFKPSISGIIRVWKCCAGQFDGQFPLNSTSVRGPTERSPDLNFSAAAFHLCNKSVHCCSSKPYIIGYSQSPMTTFLSQMKRIVVPPTFDMCRYKCIAHRGNSVSAFKYLLFMLLFSSEKEDTGASSSFLSSSSMSLTRLISPKRPDFDSNFKAASISGCASGGGLTALTETKTETLLVKVVKRKRKRNENGGRRFILLLSLSGSWGSFLYRKLETNYFILLLHAH